MGKFLGQWVTLLAWITLFGNIAVAQERPNIVWIVSEDNSKHYLALYDKGGAEMPALQSLAENGIVFNHAFSNAPVCSVARSTIITGAYAPRIGAQFHRKMELAAMPEDLKMFPHYLRKAGYYTTNNAKQDYNLVVSDDTWNQSSGKANYKNRAAGQPFFHVQNFGITHEGSLHFDQNFMDTTSLKSDIEAPLLPCYPETALFKFTNAYYRDRHLTLDLQLGKFLEELEADGVLENTIIFYYGDHGGVLPGSKGYLYDRGIHVPFIVSFPDKWRHLMPEDKNTRSDLFIEFVDLAPTVLNLAGLDVPEEFDGNAFLGEGVDFDKLAEDQTAFGYADRFDEKYDLVRSLRKGKYKYIRNYQPFNIDGLFNFYRYKMLAYQEWEQLFRNGELSSEHAQFFMTKPAEALFDLENDPHELVNIAGEAEFRDELLELRSLLDEKVRSMPDLSFYPESYFIEYGLGNPVAFGRKNKAEISSLINIANLQLISFDDARQHLQQALESNDFLKKYWALIVCTTFGQEAAEFYETAREIATSDSDNLSRIRAWSFLALSGENIDLKQMAQIVKNAKSETECNLMLNTVALLKTKIQDFAIDLPHEDFPAAWVDQPNDLVNRRLDFINSK